MVKWLQGKKTYLVALTAGIVAVVSSLGYAVPEWVWPALASLGLGFLRAGVKKDV